MITKETDKSPIDFMSSKIHVPGHKKYFKKIFFYLKPYKTNTIIIMQLNSESIIEIKQICVQKGKRHTPK